VLTACEQAVSTLLWHIPLLCVQWKTPDDGQRNCPKHVEFYSENKFEKLVHTVGFIIRIYHDARSPERQNWLFIYVFIECVLDYLFPSLFIFVVPWPCFQINWFIYRPFTLSLFLLVHFLFIRPFSIPIIQSCGVHISIYNTVMNTTLLHFVAIYKIQLTVILLCSWLYVYIDI